MRTSSPEGRLSGRTWVAGAALLGGLGGDAMSQEQLAWHGTGYASPERQMGGGVRKQESAASLEILRFEQRWREVDIEQLNAGFDSILQRIETAHREAIRQREEGRDLESLHHEISQLRELIIRAYGETYSRSPIRAEQGDEMRLAAFRELEQFSPKRQEFTQRVLRKMLDMGALDDEAYGIAFQALRDTWGTEHYVPVQFNG